MYAGQTEYYRSKEEIGAHRLHRKSRIIYIITTRPQIAAVWQYSTITVMWFDNEVSFKLATDGLGRLTADERRNLRETFGRIILSFYNIGGIYYSGNHIIYYYYICTWDIRAYRECVSRPYYVQYIYV